MHSKLKNGRWRRSGLGEGGGSLAILSGRIIKVKTEERREEEVATAERKLPPQAGKTMEG